MRRHRQSSAMQGVQLSLIVTPMLVMSFQLLSFFIMIYSPNALEGNISGLLAKPTKEQAVKAKDKEEIKDDVIADSDPEETESLIVRIEAVPPEASKMPPEERTLKYGNRKDGEPMLIKIVTKADAAGAQVSDERYGPAEAVKRLHEELKKQVPEGAGKANLRIDNPDGNLKHLYIIAIYDACKIAGFNNISYVPPAPLKEPSAR